MNAANQILLSTPPNLLSQYGRALFAKGKKGTNRLPNTRVWLTGVRPSSKKVQSYAQVCGFNLTGNKLPLTYPHLLAFPLHMELMLHPDFPFALMGLVHIRNSITQHRAIYLQDKLDICCRFTQLRQTDKGLEFDIVTEISAAGLLLWESTSTNLARLGNKNKSTAKTERPAPEMFQQQEDWRLASNLGRRYAKVSGDSNPIHLFKLSAKLFGFPRHIAHGMWSKARAAASLQPLLNSDACTLEVEFKLPVLLPTKATFHWDSPSDAQLESRFELRSHNNQKTHMLGRIHTPS